MSNYLENISEDNVELNISANDWKDSLWKSSEILLEKDAITEEYVEAMIESVEKNGPYFVITKNIALAHARPEFGVKSEGITFTTLNPPVNFDSRFDPVKLIITLAATDSDAHVEILSELAGILSDTTRTEKLFTSKTKKQFLDILMNK